MKKKKMHLLQYMMPPVTHHSSATWKHPWNMTMTNAFQWNRPEIWQEVAQIAERGKLDAVFFADTEGITATKVPFAMPRKCLVMNRQF
ncbi:hypothetical protein [Aeribacillus sp. FSL K6-2833]|uniref:hypothetical protein n=1 Tax=Aeribacillus sp. FSL K6-2833 TaxID=2954611 RepID=UPI0030DDBD80